MSKIIKKFIESFVTESKYSNMLARRYPDLNKEDAEKKLDEIVKNQVLPEVYNLDITEPAVLDETPIDQFQTIGDFSKGSSFTKKADRAILTNPKAVQKIKDKFANTNQTFDMYFVNSKEGRIHKEVGEVTENFIRNELKLDTPINRNNITVFYTNNTGDQGVMMTAWIVAHRFGHVVRRLQGWIGLCNSVNGIIQRTMKDVYKKDMPLDRKNGNLGDNYYNSGDNSTNGKILKNFYQIIATFKSARDKKIRNQYEFMYELLAQYITTGKVTFNPLPKFIPVTYAWGKPSMGVRFHGTDADLEYYNGYLRNLEEIFGDYAEYLLDECVGKIFVM